MSHLTLDARAILDYLNESGYTNITAQQLKSFMKDLRKLIKYDEALAVKHFQNSTASFRAKVNGMGEEAKQSNIPMENCGYRHATRIKRANYEPAINKLGKQATKSQPSSSSNSQTINSNKNSVLPDSQSKPKKPNETEKENNKPKMWIRSKQSLSQKPFKCSDPVELYHFYQKEWIKFRDQLPGENNHMELRWEIRNKLLGAPSQRKCEKY